MIRFKDIALKNFLSIMNNLILYQKVRQPDEASEIKTAKNLDGCEKS